MKYPNSVQLVVFSTPICRVNQCEEQAGSDRNALGFPQFWYVGVKPTEPFNDPAEIV
jgi:hypothetical protein